MSFTIEIDQTGDVFTLHSLNENGSRDETDAAAKIIGLTGSPESMLAAVRKGQRIIDALRRAGHDVEERVFFRGFYLDRLPSQNEPGVGDRT